MAENTIQPTKLPAVRDAATVAATLDLHRETGLAGAELKMPGLNMNFGDPQSVLDTAKLLTKFVKDNKLSSNISGKDYANVEAWQFLFMLAGYDVIIESCVRDVDANWVGDADGNPVRQYIAYTASAVLTDRDNKVVGRGIAYCTNEPGDKGGYQQYAVASFAQTRAVGKAGRNKFAFILKAAGFEATPAEETTQFAADAGTGATEVSQVNKPAGKRRPGQPAPVQPVIPVVQIEDVTPEEPAQAEADHTVEPVVSEPVSAEPLASDAQKQRIIVLCNDVAVPKANKDAILKNLPTASEAKADEVIAKLEIFIEKTRGPKAPVPAATTPTPAAEAEVTTVEPGNPPAANPEQEFPTPAAPAPAKPAGPKRPGAIKPAPEVVAEAAVDNGADEAEKPVGIPFTGDIAKRMLANLKQDGQVALDAIKDRFRSNTYSYDPKNLDKFNVLLLKDGYSLGAEFGYDEAPAK